MEDIAKNDVKELIETFVSQTQEMEEINLNLKNFLEIYAVLKDRIEKLEIKTDSNISGDIETLVNKINVLNTQSEKLSGNFSGYIKLTDKFNSTIISMTDRFSALEEKITKLEQTESKITSSLKKLDSISEDVAHFRVDTLTEKLSMFDSVVSQILNSLDGKISENLVKNNEAILKLQKDFNEQFENVENSNKSLEKIAEQSDVTSKALNSLLDKNEIDKSYLYEVLDQWSKDRNIKIKK